jgi:hypothetical protein
LKAWTVRIAPIDSSRSAPTAATRACVSRDNARTRRPNTTIGTTTTGTTRQASAVSQGEVTSIIRMPPTTVSALRAAIEVEEPSTPWITVVSAVRRETISPVRPES